MVYIVILESKICVKKRKVYIMFFYYGCTVFSPIIYDILRGERDKVLSAIEYRSR